MTQEAILHRLTALADEKNAEFQKRLMPSGDGMLFLGVRTPALRALAKEAAKEKDTDAFLQSLPHAYFDENQLHALILCEEKDAQKCLERIDAFLPFVDHWATCDQLLPRCLAGDPAALLERIDSWLQSDHVYTVRFAIGMLMKHFLTDGFDPRYPARVAAIRSREYYVRMMQAWYFAEALVKRYDEAIPYFTEKRLETWTHNKALQKARESWRISPDTKQYLQTLKIK